MELKRVGSVSWGGNLRRAFLFDDVALTLQHWLERTADGNECGVRIEIQRLAENSASEVATEFAAKVLRVAGPIWRADIFTLSSGVPLNLDRAHYHSKFNGDEPCDREWDERLTSSYLSWLLDNLLGISIVFERAGVPDLARSRDCERIADCSKEIVAAVALMMDDVWNVARDFVLE
jgi:hypothetical protein